MGNPKHCAGLASVLLCAGWAWGADPSAPNASSPPVSSSWPQRLEAGWLLEEQLRADTRPARAAVSTRDDAAGGVDGIKNGEWGFHTAESKEPWWQVDLGAPQPVARVVVWNRCQAPERAAKLMVRLSDDGREWRTVYQHHGAVFYGFTDKKPLEVTLTNQTARWVRIQLPGTAYLHLEEVEVFNGVEPARNLALHRPADQVSTSPWSYHHAPSATPQVDWVARTKATLAVCERLTREVGAAHLSGERGTARPHPDPLPQERETRTQRMTKSKAIELAPKPQTGFPLPGGEGQGEGERASIAQLERRLAALSTNASAQPLFLEARLLQRQLAFRNPLLNFDTLLFTKRVPSSFNHMSDQYYGWFSKPGGGIYVLRLTDDASRAPREECLTTSFTHAGSFLRPTLSYDGTRVLFAWCRHYPKLADEKDKLNKANVPEDAFYHLFEMNLDGSDVRQLTRGKYDDFDGRYLPDGRIVFLSTRRGQALQVGRETAAQTLVRPDLPDCYVRCGGGPERPVAVYTLHTMKADGTDLCAISPFEMFEWTPEIGRDGSILYSRWDYIDRDNMPYMGLWAINPDGANARLVYGNYTKAPHCTFEPKSVPGSHKVVFTASAHHAQTMGSLVLLDPAVGLEGKDPITRLTPEVPFPEIEAWPKTSYASPWPLSERFHLVAWGHEGARVPGPAGWDRWHAVQRPRNGMDLYLYDAATGARELLWADPDFTCGDPIPVRPRERPPVVASALALDGPKEGRFLLADVTRGLKTVKPGEVRSLRLVAVPAKTHPTMNFPNLGVTRDDPGKCVLGTVPVEPDGSAYFRAPAGVIVFFQALDAQGLAVQTMRSATHVQPGQTLSCIGCHEHRQQAPPARSVLAALREPSKITVGPEGSWALRFDKLVQPVLDAQCVRCHSPKSEDLKAAKFDLTPAKAYEALVGYGKPSLQDQVWEGYRRGYSVEGEGPARRSALLALIERGHYDTKLTASDRERLFTWMDTYAQRSGAFDAGQEQRLEDLRRASAPLLIEREPTKRAALRSSQLVAGGE